MADRDSVNAKGLLAVILVARLRPGPRIIFRYPASPQRLPASQNGIDHSDSHTALGHGFEDQQLGPTTQASKGVHAEPEETINNSNSFSRDPDSGTLLGYSVETLQKLLSPGCWADRKRFEICLDDLAFVGHPIWAAQDGSWSKRHVHDDGASKLPETPSSARRAVNDVAQSEVETGVPIAEAQATSDPAPDFKHVPESFDSRTGGQSFATSLTSGSDVSAPVAPEQMTTFHVVFVLDASRAHSDQQLASDVYEHIAKKLSKALNHCQKQNQYVGLETKKMLLLSSKARQDGMTTESMTNKMIETSELAWALKEVYDKTLEGEIAGLRLNGAQLSLQIPQNAQLYEEDTELEPHAGLLLLQRKEVLLRELAQADASPLAYFLREHTPTKSLQKLSTRLGLPLDEILSLARHLIKWRKARAITPLHPRNTYIGGRDAPLDQLQTFYIEDFGRKFPVLPSLPQVLKVVNGKPIKWGALIPSSDHRAPYMELLAYLVQHRFVEQLKTYGWLQAPTTRVEATPRPTEEINENRRPLSALSLLSPQMRPVLDDDTVSISSERTTIPISVVENARRRAGITTQPQNSMTNVAEVPEMPQPILDPGELSAEDVQRLRHIRDSVDDQELSDRLPSLLRYFDGRCAFEGIAARQGLKRSKTDVWLDVLQREGYLSTFRSA